MKSLGWTVAVAAILLILPAPVAAQQPEPAWCSGSWEPSAVDEQGRVVERGGTNFGICRPVTKMVDGKNVTVQTYPAYPASRVVIRQDDRGNWVGGTMVSEKGADGTTVQKFVPIAPRVVKKS